MSERDYFVTHALLAVGFGLLFSSVSVTVICILSSCFLLLFFDRHVHRMDHLVFCCLVAAFSVILIYYGNVQMYGSPYFLGRSDDRFFEESARYVIERDAHTIWDIRQLSYFDPRNDYRGFLLILADLMRFCHLFDGYHTICFRFLNVYLWLAVALLMSSHYGRKFPGDLRNARRIFLFIALFPNALFISSHVFRDTVGIFLIVFFYVRIDLFFSRSCSWTHRLFIVLYCIPILYLAYWVRNFNFYISLIILVLSFVFMDVKNKKKHYAVSLCVIAAGILLAVFRFDLIRTLNRYNASYSGKLLRDNQGLSQVVFSAPLFPLGFLYRLVFGLLSPMPVSIFKPFREVFAINTVIDALVGTGTIAQLYLLPYILFSFRSMKKMSFTFWAVLAAIVCTTFTFRHFITVYPFLIPLMIRGLSMYDYDRRRTLFIVQSIFIAALLGGYVLLR